MRYRPSNSGWIIHLLCEFSNFRKQKHDWEDDPPNVMDGFQVQLDQIPRFAQYFEERNVTVSEEYRTEVKSSTGAMTKNATPKAEEQKFFCIDDEISPDTVIPQETIEHWCTVQDLFREEKISSRDDSRDKIPEHVRKYFRRVDNSVLKIPKTEEDVALYRTEYEVPVNFDFINKIKYTAPCIESFILSSLYLRRDVPHGKEYKLVLPTLELLVKSVLLKETKAKSKE